MRPEITWEVFEDPNGKVVLVLRDGRDVYRLRMSIPQTVRVVIYIYWRCLVAKFTGRVVLRFPEDILEHSPDF